MTIMDKACYERGCACYDSRDGEEGVEVVAKRKEGVNATAWRGLTPEQIEQGCKESWVTLQAWQSAVWWAEEQLKAMNSL